MRMKILITGGAGFIGSHTVEALLRAGHTVRVVDNLSTGQPDNLPSDVELIVDDVTDLAALNRAIAGSDAIIHLAALVSVPQSLSQPLHTYMINTTGTAHVLEAARLAGVRRVVFASTCAVYGDSAHCNSESSLTHPLVPYATSKLMSEQLLHIYAQCYEMETVCLRYFNVYGPRQHFNSPYSGVIARWSEAVRNGQPCTVYGDGMQSRDFISVHDVAQANLLALTERLPHPHNCYNVATGTSISLNHLLDAFSRASGRIIERSYAPARAGDILHSAANVTQLRQLGWLPHMLLEQGLAELIRSGHL